MLAYPLAAIVLLGSNGAVVAGASVGRSKIPKSQQKRFSKDLYGNSKKSAALRKKFIASSTFVGGRRLEDADAAGGAEDAGAYYDDAWVEEEEGEGEYDFDPSGFALSYHRCAAVQQYDDDVAAMEDTTSVFATKNFAVFRFCPVDTCDADFGEEDEEEEAEEEEQENGGRRRRLEEEPQEEEGDVSEYYEQQQYGQQQRYQDVYGARGRGCKKNYGEYMIELEEYLKLMTEHQEEQVEQYCEYCEEYMYELYMEAYEDCTNNGNCRRDLKFDEFKEETALHRELGYDYGICKQYQNACNGALDDDITEYLECKGANGAYVGPHCAEDGYTVTLGVYADEDCNVYTGGNVANVLGYEPEEDVLKNWYNSRHGALDILFEGQEDALCISCEDQGDDFFQRMNEGDADGDDDANYDEDDANDDGGRRRQVRKLEEDAEEDAITNDMGEICKNMYESSAHCHKNYRSFRRGDLTATQWKEMQLSCAFIDSIVVGNYDELGYVNLKNNWNWLPFGNKPVWARSDNMYAATYSSAPDQVTPLQVFFLVFSILACAILVVWSKTLHTSLTKKEPWAPGRNRWTAAASNVFRKGQDNKKQDQADIGLGPSDSGIGASRVRSEHSQSSYYLT